MFSVSFEKDIVNMLNRPFDVRLYKHKVENGVLYRDIKEDVLSGVYIANERDIISSDINTVVNELKYSGDLELPMIIFTSTGIWREPTLQEQESNKAICDSLGIKIDRPKYGMGDTLRQIANFTEVLQLAKNKEMFNKFTALEVDSIAFLELDDTEGDFILSKEAEHITEVEAPNGNKFNIYRLW